MNENESLRKSHSKLSNFRLTLLCLLMAVLFSLLFLSIALSFVYGDKRIYLYATIVLAVLNLFGLILFFLFHR